MSAWKPTTLGWPTSSSSLHHVFPTVHAAPADLAFRRQPFAVVFGDLGGFLERLRDLLGVAFGVLCPNRSRRGGINAHDAVGPDAQVAQFLGDAAGLANLLDKFLAVLVAAHRRTAARRRPDRRDHRADHKTLRADLVRQPFQIVVVESMLTCGSNRNRSTPSNFTPLTSALAVRSSMVSRSMARFRAGAAFADQAGPHGVVQFGKVIGCGGHSEGLF